MAQRGLTCPAFEPSLECAFGRPDEESDLPYNAGKRLDGRSLLPLLAGGMGFDDPQAHARAEPPWWWRDAVYAELGVAATVKHRSGWQLVALHMPEEFEITSDSCACSGVQPGSTCRPPSLLLPSLSEPNPAALCGPDEVVFEAAAHERACVENYPLLAGACAAP